MEQKKEEENQARYYDRMAAGCSLDTIKESPSTASMAGILAGGLSSASVNTVLASPSTSSVPGDVYGSPGIISKVEHKVDRISEEKDIRDSLDAETTREINASLNCPETTREI